jgi:hypothetical protein
MLGVVVDSDPRTVSLSSRSLFLSIPQINLLFEDSFVKDEISVSNVAVTVG